VSNLNLDVAISCMRQIVSMGAKGYLDTIRVTKAEFDKFVGPEAWLPPDRNSMAQVLNTLLSATLDSMLLNRFSLPAEFVAAGIATFVHGINTQPACYMASQLPVYTAEDMGRGLASPQACSDKQLFALVVQLYDSPARNAARAQFEKFTGLALERAENIKK